MLNMVTNPVRSMVWSCLGSPAVVATHLAKLRSALCASTWPVAPSRAATVHCDCAGVWEEPRKVEKHCVKVKLQWNLACVFFFSSSSSFLLPSCYVTTKTSPKFSSLQGAIIRMVPGLSFSSHKLVVHGVSESVCRRLLASVGE